LSGAQDGDLVRARIDDRNAEVVVGVLRLRHVPSLNYVQVHVVTDDGFERVDPASVEVIEVGAFVVSNSDLEDPLKGDPGWRRITDLDAAISEGLVEPARLRQGGTWEDMEERLRNLASPLLESGWSVFDTDRNTSGESGDSVHLILNREDTTIDLELYEDDYMTLWPVNFEKYEQDDWESEEPLASIDGATAENCRAAFVEVGWLDPS
jgi:hypothetical protein